LGRGCEKGGLRPVARAHHYDLDLMKFTIERSDRG
jgi:hypothetical protein